MRGDCPLASNLPQTQALVLGLPQAPAHGTPDLLLPFSVSPPPSPALPLAWGLLMWSMDDVGRDFPKKWVCFMPGRCACPTCSAQRRGISFLLSKTGEGHHCHLPVPPCPEPPAPPTAANTWLRRQRVQKEKYRTRVCGANKSWGGLGVRVPTRPARGRAPRGVGGLSPRGPLVRAPSVHAQVRELHLVHRDGVVLGLAVSGCDGAGGARWWPGRQDVEGG